MHRIIHQASDRSPTPLQLRQAASWLARLRGLLGCRSLSAGEGLWIRPCNSVHSCFMRFPIDVLYLDREQRVMDIRHDLAPWRMSACWRAHSVVEMAAGEVRRLGIQTGDLLQCDS